MTILRVLAGILAGAGIADAASPLENFADVAPETPRADEPPAGISDSALSLRGVFNSELPGIERKGRLKLILHPHLGDLLKYDYQRVALGLRYSISSHLELSGEANTYFGNGLHDVGFFEEYGLADARFGFKYRVGGELLPGWESGFGASYTMPVGSPPPQLTDGLEHVRPFITFARTLETHPNWRVFWKVGADLVTPTGIEGKHEKNELTDDATSFGGGFVWHRGKMYYTLEAGYETTELIGTAHDNVFMIRPGVIWEIPGRSERGKWVIGLALTLSQGPDGTEVGVGGKLRLDFDLNRGKASSQ
jgi:hypothetical protein